MTSRLRRVFLALAVSLAPACSEAPPPLPPLRLAFDLWPGYYPAPLAAGSGIFDSLGLRITLHVPQNTKAMLADFSARRYDLLAASVADVFPVLQAVPDLRFLFCTDESAGADALVASGPVGDIAALRRGRIGVKLGGFAELLVRRMLARAGLGTGDVELVDMDASRVPEALRSGNIVAGETWEPYLTELRRDGFRVLASSADYPGLIVECVVTHGDIAARRGDELEKLAIAWFLAQERLLASPATTLPVVGRVLAQPESTLGIAGVHFLDRAENRRRFAGADSATSLTATITAYEGFFGSLGMLRGPINPARLFDDRFVR